MPCRMPSHVFDVDDATAERLTTLLTIRRRTRFRLILAALLVFATATAALAYSS